MPISLRPSDLDAYLDEALPPEEMARIEEAVRADPNLIRRLAKTLAQRDAGVHSLGAIWRRHQITCPSREQLGSYLLDVLPDDLARYIRFHLEQVGCRPCQANLADLARREKETSPTVQTRRRKYFQSTAGYLRREDQ